MKKLLLTSAVLVGMGASQAFAADTDSWTGIISASVENYCAIDADPDLLVGGAATAQNNIADAGTGALTAAELDLADSATGLLNPGLTIGVEFEGDSVVCNYAHNFTVMSSLGGLASANAEDNTLLGAGSDLFQTKLPYALAVEFWHANANSATAWAAPTVANVGNYSDRDAGTYALNDTDHATGGTEGADITTYAVAAVPAFHNDGANGTEGGTTGSGLLLTFALSPSDGNPLLAGNYADAVMLKIGGSI